MTANAVSLVLNAVLVAMELWSFRLVRHRKWKNLVFYTQISNLITFLSSAAFLIAGAAGMAGNAPVTALRYLSVCMMVMTALVTACILVPMGGDPKVLLWSGNGLYHHVLCPVITTISYVFFELHAGTDLLWLPVTVTLVYGLVMLWLNWKRTVDGPYPFFRVRNQSATATVIWMAALVGMIAAISAVVCLVS